MVAVGSTLYEAAGLAVLCDRALAGLRHALAFVAVSDPRPP
jgi:hypothetical protein